MTTDLSGSQHGGTSGLRKLLLLLLVGLPLGLLGAEGAMRLASAAKGDAYDSEAARVELREQRSRLLDPLPRPGGDEAEAPGETKKHSPIVHPFFGTDTLGSLERLGLNLRERSAREPGKLRVVVLGGSVAGLFGLSGARHLRESLHELPEFADTTIEFMTYARGGHKQPQQLLRLSHLLALGMRPDVVINLDGFNEVALANKNHSMGMHPTYPSYSHWMKFARNLGQDEEQHARVVAAEVAKARLVEELEDALASAWLRSAIYAHFAESRIAERRLAYEAARDDYLDALDVESLPPGVLGPKFEGTSKDAIRESIVLWMECSRQIQVLCDAYDIRYLHVLQPTLHDVGAKPVTPEEKKKGRISELWLEGVRVGYPLMRAGGEVLASEGIAFYDATQVFADVRESLYYDNCHFGNRGNELLADAIAERLAPLLVR